MAGIRGIIFDLDGTLVDSRLDFPAMRSEMGLEPGLPILEALASVTDEAQRNRMIEIMHAHELRGADLAVLIDGVSEFLQHLKQEQILTAILTRNSRACTERTLRRMNLDFSQILTREDAPPKPDPSGVRLIASRWQFQPAEVIVIGDYLFDLQAGNNAGMRSVLYAPDILPDYADEADFILKHFRDGISLLNEIHVSCP